MMTMDDEVDGDEVDAVENTTQVWENRIFVLG